MYSPTMERFLTPEPSGANPYVDGLNLYEAFQDNPINRVDPTGLQATKPQKFSNVKLVIKIISATITDPNTIEYKYQYENYKVEGVCSVDGKQFVSLDTFEKLEMRDPKTGEKVDSLTDVGHVTKPKAVVTDDQALQYVQGFVWKDTPAWWYNIPDPVLMHTKFPHIGPVTDNNWKPPAATNPATNP